MTAIGTICADGTSDLPLYIIFKGKDLNTKWIPDNVPRNWRFSASTNGWTSNDRGKDWLREDFEPHTREKANGKPRVLICDGHGSHLTGDFVEHCYRNNIKLLILPPHSSHFTQPLDIAIFSPLKEYLTQALLPLLNTHINTVQKFE